MNNNNKIWYWALTVSLGGFLFGFDTAVISGVEKTIGELWSLTELQTGQMVGMALYGTIIGALLGSFPADQLGRKRSLQLIALLYLLSAGWSALATDLTQLMIARFIGGLGVGASSVIAPMYITEIAPAEKRGQLVAAFQFNLVLGIVVAYASNYFIGGNQVAENWRIMLGVEVIPAIAFLVLLFKVPRSPRWLVVKANQSEEALMVLKSIDPDSATEQLAAIQASNRVSSTVSLGHFFSGKYRRPILLAFLFAMFNQISGINAVIYYAPRIFESAGMAADSALLQTIGIGVVNLVFTLIGMLLIDRLGRKQLMYIGTAGYLLSLGGLSYVFGAEGAVAGTAVAGLLFLFIAAHAIGQGAVIWVFISEIFPNEVRGLGASLGSSTHWLFAAFIAGSFPVLASSLGQSAIFGIFALCMVGQLLFVIFLMPETSKRRLEDLSLD